MKTKRLVTAFIFALACSGLLTWTLSRHFASAGSAERVTAASELVVASRDIHTGDPISITSLTQVALPTRRILTGTFRSYQPLVGRVARVPISLGELIMEHDLAPVDAGSGLAVVIPAGMRAISIHVTDDHGGKSAFILPGSYVDILVTYRSNADDGFVSSMVLQDKKVLAVGDDREVGSVEKLRSNENITLLVSPDEAGRLTAADSLGKLTLVLRNGSDRTLSAGPFRIKLDVERIEQQGARPAQHRAGSVVTRPGISQGFQVETLAGGKSIIQTFQGEKQ